MLVACSLLWVFWWLSHPWRSIFNLNCIMHLYLQYLLQTDCFYTCCWGTAFVTLFSLWYPYHVSPTETAGWYWTITSEQIITLVLTLFRNIDPIYKYSTPSNSNLSPPFFVPGICSREIFIPGAVSHKEVTNKSCAQEIPRRSQRWSRIVLLRLKVQAVGLKGRPLSIQTAELQLTCSNKPSNQTSGWGKLILVWLVALLLCCVMLSVRLLLLFVSSFHCISCAYSIKSFQEF